MFIDLFVAYGCNFIYKDHDVCFKDLGGISKVSYVAKSKYCHYFLTRNHDIDNRWIFNDSAYDFSSSFTESNG